MREGGTRHRNREAVVTIQVSPGVAWTPVGVLKIVKSGHIVDRILGVLGTGSLDVVCE